jgi:hypothetical protein
MSRYDSGEWESIHSEKGQISLHIVTVSRDEKKNMKQAKLNTVPLPVLKAEPVLFYLYLITIAFIRFRVASKQPGVTWVAEEESWVQKRHFGSIMSLIFIIIR